MRSTLRRRTLSVALAVVAAGGYVAQAQAKPMLYFAGDVTGGINVLNLDGTDPRTLVDQERAGTFRIQDLKADATRVYWLDTGRIGAVTVDGKQVNKTFEDPLVNIQDQGLGIAPTAFAVDSRYFYFAWARQGIGFVDNAVVGIGRVSLDGSNIEPNFIDSSLLSADRNDRNGGAITSVAVDAGRVYWADARSGRIGRARLDGTDIQPQFITDLPTGEAKLEVAVATGFIYWSYPGVTQSTENGPGLRYDTGIGRARLDGTDVRRPFRRAFRAGDSIAVNRDYLYWGAEGSGIYGRMNLDGSDVFARFYPGSGTSGVPHQIAISPGVPLRASKRCSIAKTSVVRGEPLTAVCRGVSGRVTITVAATLSAAAAAPAGTLDVQQRSSRTVRRGRLSISTTKFCRDRFLTDRYRILLTRNGSEALGAATVRVRSSKPAQRCSADSPGING